MKIWLVEGGVYDDYEVVGVFSSEENAKVYRDKWKADKKRDMYPYEAQVAERELDPEYPT